jgi:hypothetical protein
MKRATTMAAVLLCAAAPAATAAAHPGHGQSEPTSVWHYLTEPLHVAVALAAVAAALLLARLARRARRPAHQGS